MPPETNCCHTNQWVLRLETGLSEMDEAIVAYWLCCTTHLSFPFSVSQIKVDVDLRV